MSHFSKILGGTAVALTLMVGATQASAALITDWGYQIDSGFSAFAPVGAIPAGVEGSGPDVGLGPTTLSWGTGDNGPSTLSVTPSVSAVSGLLTNVNSVPGASITHDNNAIDANDASLISATLSSTLVLTPFAPGGPSLPEQDLFFDIAFTETENTDGTCVGDATSVCDDIFVLADVGSLTEQFVIDGFLYTLSLTVIGLGPLAADACAAAGVGAGCVGFITPEGQPNTLDTLVSISARPVSEPGTLAILGLGLLGLGIARRRKAAA